VHSSNLLLRYVRPEALQLYGRDVLVPLAPVRFPWNTRPAMRTDEEERVGWVVY
jgi:hypothetical protein